MSYKYRNVQCLKFILNTYYKYKRKEIYEAIFCNIFHILFIFHMINYELQVIVL